jgi:hypothetical protein
MAREAPLFRPYRQAVLVSGSVLAFTLAIAVALTLAGPTVGRVISDLGVIVLPLGLFSLLLLTVGLVATSIRAAPPAAGFALAAEEPLIMAPRLPLVQRDAPLVLVLGAIPKAGATTLTTSLALLVAEEGRSPQDSGRRPRPLVLLERPEVANRNGQPGWLTEYLAEHPTSVRDDVVELAVRHASGAELLRLAEGEMNAIQLRQLLSMFRRYYDLIVFNAMVEDHRTVQAAMELADAIVLVIPDRRDGIAAMTRWAERVYGLGLEGKSILAVTRRLAPSSVVSSTPFLFGFELPEDVTTVEPGVALTAWPRTSAATRQLRKAARTLLPQLFVGDSS